MPTDYKEKLKPFFSDKADFAKVAKLPEVLDWPVSMLKAYDAKWAKTFEELEIETIKDLAQYKEPIMAEGIDTDLINKTAMIAEMLFWQITQLAEKGDQKKKIMIFGLDNAGKTAVLTALSERYSSIKQLLPTRGLVRKSINIFGFEVMSFDMGGQEDYRKQYFEKADMYFSACDLVIFCIDIQDTKRFDESIDYLKRIMDTFDKFKFYPPVLAVFTKMDPDLMNDVELNKARIKMIDRTEEVCRKHDIGYANSSIFDRNSIENLFSLALKRISTSNAVIEELLHQFIDEVEAQACCLISVGGLVYGSFGKTKQEEEMLNNSASYLQNLYLFHLSQGLKNEETYSMQYKANNLNFIAEFITEAESGAVFLWVLTKNLEKETRSITKFKDDLIPLIKIFL